MARIAILIALPPLAKGTCCCAAPSACCCAFGKCGKWLKCACAGSGTQTVAVASTKHCPFEGHFIRCLIQSKALIVVCVGQVPQKGRFARQLVFVAFRLEAYAKFAFCFFAAWNVGIWAGFRATAAAAGPANSATPWKHNTKKKAGEWKPPKPWGLTIFFFLFACPGAVPLFRTTAAVAALQLQFSRICLKQIYMEGSVRAEFINAALEKLPRFFVVFFFFDFAIISWSNNDATHRPINLPNVT